MFTKKSIYQIHLSVVHDGNNSGIKIKPKLLVVSLAPLNSKTIERKYCNSSFALKDQLLKHSTLIHEEILSKKYSEKDQREMITSEDEETSNLGQDDTNYEAKEITDYR